MVNAVKIMIPMEPIRLLVDLNSSGLEPPMKETEMMAINIRMMQLQIITTNHRDMQHMDDIVMDTTNHRDMHSISRSTVRISSLIHQIQYGSLQEEGTLRRLRMYIQLSIIEVEEMVMDMVMDMEMAEEEGIINIKYKARVTDMTLRDVINSW